MIWEEVSTEFSIKNKRQVLVFDGFSASEGPCGIFFFNGKFPFLKSISTFAIPKGQWLRSSTG